MLVGKGVLRVGRMKNKAQKRRKVVMETGKGMWVKGGGRMRLKLEHGTLEQ